MMVVPKADQLDPKKNVAVAFFTLTFGAISGTQPKRILSAFMAISSFGNIVVMTFTASRGLLPSYLKVDVIKLTRLHI
jgi:hypothetical protein